MNCERCSGRGYSILRRNIGDANFPDDYIAGVTRIVRIQPCPQCKGTGRADKRNIDKALIALIFER